MNPSTLPHNTYQLSLSRHRFRYVGCGEYGEGGGEEGKGRADQGPRR